MRRRHARRKINFGRLKLPFLAISLIAAIISIGVLIFRIFTIREIRCESQYGPCNEVLLESLQNGTGKNYFVAKKEIDSLLQSGFVVKSYSIRLKSPSELLVQVIERKATAAVAREGKMDQFFAIDSEGFVVSGSQTSNLPVLILKYDKEFKIGEKASSEIQFGVKILRELAITYTVRVAYMEENNITAGLPNGMTVIFPLEGEPEVILGSLSLILSRLNSTGARLTINESGIVPKTIDLRFKNPVLK